jgi:hypothetical protein
MHCKLQHVLDLLPEDGLSETETYWGLQSIYMIFKFLIILNM